MSQNLLAGIPVDYTRTSADINRHQRSADETFEKDREESLRALTLCLGHDFSNFMGNILATVELAESLEAEGEFPRRELQDIKIVAVRALELVRELMIFGADDERAFEAVNVPRLVEEILGIARASISKRATLTTHLPPDLPPVRANPTRIRQVAMNLVLNASEALVDGGGVIHVGASLANAEHAVGFDERSRVFGNCLRLEVSDTGCGMTQEQQARIFDPCFTTKKKGRGLGLTVVRGVVQSVGGVINVASAPGRGTTFEVLLPCVQSHAAAAAS